MTSNNSGKKRLLKDWFSSSYGIDHLDIGRHLLLFFFVTFFVPFLFALVYAPFIASEQNQTYWDRVGSIYISPISILFGLEILFLQMLIRQQAKNRERLNTISTEITTALNSYNKNIDDRIDWHFKHTKIVFAANIEDYNDKHLNALKKILNELDKKSVDKIYAIDNSDPIQWWSETMTGYMALLSNWKAQKPGREVYRIFVLSKNNLLSYILPKTLTLHSLMGLRTYVFSEDEYNQLFNQFCDEMSKSNEEILIKKREILIWENSHQNGADCIVNDSNDRWENITCYLSFWDIGVSQSERKMGMNVESHEWDNYHGKKISTKEIKDMWFDFIPMRSLYNRKGNWPNLPIQYQKFINYLIDKNSLPCKHNGDILTDHKGGIEIISSSFKNGKSHPEFVTNDAIRGILETYAKK